MQKMALEELFGSKYSSRPQIDNIM